MNGHTAICPCQPSVPTIPVPFPTNFTTFIRQLSNWEAHLLRHFKLQCSLPILSTSLSNNTPLFLCSDGSAPLFRGSFGGTCATDDGTILFTLSGPAPGFRTSSFRAESYGLLAVLRFIVQVCNFHSLALPSTLRMYTDSKSLVDTCYQRLEWTIDYPYSTMSADWDIQQCITATLRQFATPPIILHIKGHQDLTQPLDSLSLPARLNVHADELAGQYQYPPETSSTLCPLILGTTIHLQSPDGTITSNYRNNLRRRANTPVICQFIRSKLNWSQETFDSVCWETHGAVLRANFSFRHFLTKFIHNWLPLGCLKQHYAQHYVSDCPNCPTTLEDRHHFLRCSHRVNWTGPLFDSLYSFWTEHHFDPNLQTIFQEATLSWLGDTSPTFPSFSDSYSNLLSRQANVGWFQLFLGRFTWDWVYLQDSFVRHHSLHPTKFSGRQLVSGSIKILWQHVHDLWLRRNLDCHGRDSASRESAALAQAQREVAHLYTLRSFIPLSDRFMFYPSLTDHFRQEPRSYQLRTWLNTWRPLILSSAPSG